MHPEKSFAKWLESTGNTSKTIALQIGAQYVTGIVERVYDDFIQFAAVFELGQPPKKIQLPLRAISWASDKL